MADSQRARDSEGSSHSQSDGRSRSREVSSGGSRRRRHDSGSQEGSHGQEGGHSINNCSALESSSGRRDSHSPVTIGDNGCRQAEQGNAQSSSFHGGQDGNHDSRSKSPADGSLPAEVSHQCMVRMHEAVCNGDLERTTALIRRYPELCDISFKDGRRPLVLAVEHHHFTIAQFLLENGAHPSSSDNSVQAPDTKRKRSSVRDGAAEVAPLQLAFNGSDARLMQLLISHGASPSDCEQSIQDLATWAVRNQDRELLEVIVRRFQRYRRRGPALDLIPLLHEAVDLGYSDIVRALIGLGANPDKEWSGTAPLLIAADKGDMAMCHLLVECGAHLMWYPQPSDMPISPPLVLAIMCGKRTAFHNLISLGCDVNSQRLDWPNGSHVDKGFYLRWKCPVLHCAVYKRNIEFLVELVEAGADLSLTDCEGNTVLHLACFSIGEVAMLKKLMELMSKVRAKTSKTNLLVRAMHSHNMDGLTPLMAAASNGTSEYMQLLLESGAKVDKRAVGPGEGKTVLIFALESGSEDALLCLLRHGCNVNLPHAQYRRALHHAIELGNAHFVKILLDFGADPNLVTRQGESPLQEAIWANMGLETVQLLVERGAQVNHATSFGDTALMCCARHDSPEICQFLIEKGALLNVKDYTGGTAVVRAVCYWAVRTAQVLIKEGADVNLSDKWFVYIPSPDTFSFV